MNSIRTLLHKISRYKLIITILVAIIIALILTVISVSLYVKSGVASLDLSRPGYADVRDQVRPNTSNERFNASGPINEAALTRFMELYQSEVSELPEESSFSDESLSDEQLRLNVGE